MSAPDAPDGTVGPPETATPREKRVWDAIDGIPDPHIPASLVEMGMVYGVAVEDGRVTVELTYPCLGCPAYDMIQDDVRERVGEVDGVESVGIDVVWDPPWSKAMVAPEVREKIRAAGIDI